MDKILKLFGCGKRKNKSNKKKSKHSSGRASTATQESSQQEPQTQSTQPNAQLQPTNEQQQQEPSPSIQPSSSFSPNGLNLSPILSNDDILIKDDSPLICPYEYGKITFTKNGLVSLFNILNNMEGYKEYYNKNNLQLEVKTTGSPVNSEFYLIKSIYLQNKKDLGTNASYDNIIKLMYNVKDRIKWDKAVKQLEQFEGNENVFVIRTWAHSFMMISERESIEKRFIFKYDDGAHYVFSTSVPDEFQPKIDGVIKITNYFNLFRITEDEENFYFYSITQGDFKMVIPQFLINLTLPKKTIDWYVCFQKAAESTVLGASDEEGSVVQEESKIEG